MSRLHDEIVALIHELCHPATPDLSDPDRPLLEMGVDSLDYATILMAMEDRYGVTIEAEDLERLRTPRELVRYLEGRPRA